MEWLSRRQYKLGEKIAKYVHVKGLQYQNRLNLKISGSQYRNLIKGQEVNLSKEELEDLEGIGIRLKPITPSTKQKTIKKDDKE